VPPDDLTKPSNKKLSISCIYFYVLKIFLKKVKFFLFFSFRLFFLIFLNYFNTLISKIILKNKKNIILIYFKIKTLTTIPIPQFNCSSENKSGNIYKQSLI